jgi:hypothetical protein
MLLLLLSVARFSLNPREPAMKSHLPFLVAIVLLSVARPAVLNADDADGKSARSSAKGLAVTERLEGDGVWVDPRFKVLAERLPRIRVAVWFQEQLLGDGKAYSRRAKEFAGHRRRKLRTKIVKTLKWLSDKSFIAAETELNKLIKDGKISQFDRHWIVNGFSCVVNSDSLDDLKAVPGVKNIFAQGRARAAATVGRGKASFFKPVEQTKFDPERFKHPWYSRYLLANRVWKEFGITGRGTLNIIQDFNFVFSKNVTTNLYRNSGETPGNGEDDDGNGLIDDYHGFDFDRQSANLTLRQAPTGALNGQLMHAFLCAAYICGAGTEDSPYEFGIAPNAKWAGVIASTRLESAVEWAIEQEADTYSMSFSIPNLGEYRSHWRKVMEHGSFCGVYFVSGAGNFARQVATPIQMRTPEDIPEVVFAAAGIQRNFSRTVFSSKGPVEWETQHYHDGLIQKPEVCAFNSGLPALLLNGKAVPSGLNGNSFAGPMFCGSIALMLSADPDLLPWDLKEIITSTATDVGKPGVDYETGYGLINCYRAVKEVLRRKALRNGTVTKKYDGRVKGDTLDIAAIQAKLKTTRLRVAQVQPNGQAKKLGLEIGDLIVSYGGIKTNNRADLRQAKASSKGDKISVIIERDGKTLEKFCKSGQLGFVPVVEFDDPTFK